jgi:two-component system, OmpR family, copper resistance phosphate regulon response regulator CusR
MPCVLIAEDKARVAAFIVKGLEKHGFSTIVVEDGHQALQIAQEKNIELLVLDLGLPIIDGWRVLRELRSQKQSLPIIVVTAQDSKKEALAQGATDFVAKPFRFTELLKKVQSYLGIST